VITLYRLHGQEFVLNAHLISTVEATPDTVITLVNGQRFVVRDSVEDVVRKAIEYRRQLGWPLCRADQDVDAGVLGDA